MHEKSNLNKNKYNHSGKKGKGIRDVDHLEEKSGKRKKVEKGKEKSRKRNKVNYNLTILFLGPFLQCFYSRMLPLCIKSHSNNLSCLVLLWHENLNYPSFLGMHQNDVNQNWFCPLRIF